MSRPFALVAWLGAVLAMSGCERGPTSAAPAELDGADASLLADRFDELAVVALDGWPGTSFPPGVSTMAAPVPVSHGFSRTLACPAGGQVAVSGTVSGEADPATRSLAIEVRVVKTPSACTLQTRAGRSVTVTGDPTITMVAIHKIVEGVPTGPQVATQKGAFRFTTSDGGAGRCEVEFATSWDPAARTLTRQGKLCGRAVDVTRAAPRG